MTDTRKTQDVGHCRKCQFQWVIKARGKTYSHVRGLVCPFCKSADVHIEKEDNR